jgi:DNA helicase-2/ATP-dependent DNA helicase PcrA
MKYKIVGGFSFYERAEIKDLISYLTVSLNPNDSVHLLRIINAPPRGIGKTTIDALEELAVERGASIWGAIPIALQDARLPMRTLRAPKPLQIGPPVEQAEELSMLTVEKIIVRRSIWNVRRRYGRRGKPH